MTSSGSLIIKTEELGTHPATQFYQLRSILGLSNNTLEFIRHSTVKCEHCGKSFSPKPQPERKNHPIRCSDCRKLWRKEKERARKQIKLNINPDSFKKPFVLFKPTGSYIV